MALAIDRGMDHIRVLSDLSGRVVGALLGDGDSGATGSDPFSLALRRYQKEGDPAELDPRWRRAASAPPVVAGASAAPVLRRLARDLLECVASSSDGNGETPEMAPEGEPPQNVRPINAAPASVPALEQASDGSWRPSAGSVVASGVTEAAQRRHASFVPSLTSRYPLRRSSGPLVDLPLPPEASPPPPMVERAAQRPIARETPPPPREAPIAAADVQTPLPEGSSASLVGSSRSEPQSVIQAVSGGTEVVAGPFVRFQDLAAFVKALRELPGVQNVTTRQFVRGTVHLRVRHSPSLDLADSLREMGGSSIQVVSIGQGKIELAVGSPDDVPPVED